METIELLAWVGSMIAGPLSLGVIFASGITLLKAMLTRRNQLALDVLLPGGFVWLLEATLLVASVVWSSVDEQFFWMFNPSLPVAILLTTVALGIMIFAGILIQHRTV